MTEEDQLFTRLAAIHKRVQWMADNEARSAWVNGPAAQGAHLSEKSLLLDETEAILDKLEGKLIAQKP